MASPPEAQRREPPGLAPLARRMAAMAYEGVLLFAILFLASYLFLSLARDAQEGLPRFVYQTYLFAVCGAYFMFCWVRGGQTLPMKTWGMRLVTADGQALSARTALLRYLVAVPAVCSGAALVWALFDRDRQFLHDRLAGTKIIRDEGGRMKDEGSSKA